MKIIIEDFELENKIKIKIDRKIDDLSSKQIQKVLHNAFIEYLTKFNIRDVVKLYDEGHKKKGRSAVKSFGKDISSFFVK